MQGEDEQMLVSDIEDLDSTDSMEVVQLENATIVKKEKDDEPKAKNTWVIREFSKLSSGRNYSDLFKAGGCNWRVLLFPRGTRGQGSLSIFIDCADAAELPFGWSRDVEFSLTVVNQIDANHSIKRDAMQNFNSSVTNSGFEVFMLFEEFNNPSAGFLVDDTCIIIADIAVRRIVNNWLYNSKQQTGYVGLKNQGATCYMNALLQTLFHIPYFRKAVNDMPTKETASSGTITLALRDLFYKLQYSDKSVSTKDLTIAFGWNTHHSSVQHDVQELNRVLCDKLEGEMKGTVVEGTIETLFEGHVMNYIECINVDMKSTRKESFYDLQLDVKGCRDVYASFDKYVDVERLEGDNKYKAEEHGLQDAKKGILFTDFPPVLQLHLKRFEYDLMSNEMVKINDRYEFPLELDLDRENGKYMSPDADRTVRNLYTLHSTLVHSGNNVHGGHYYAYINPNLSDQWYKFDDERVTKVDINNAVEEHYGGEEKLTRASSAYMLVYVRESDKEKIICDVGEKEKMKFREEQEEKESKKRYKVDASLYTNIKEKIMCDFGEEEIRDHLKLKFRKDRKEKDSKKKYKAEASLYANIKVICDKDLRDQIGEDIYFDLVDIREIHSYRVKRQMLLNEFKEVVAKELGVPAQFQRFWIWTKRRNLTQRPSRPLDDFEELKTIDEVKKIADVAYNVDLKLYLEVELGPNKFPISPPKIADQEILIFFKFYDPEEENVRYIGRLFVNISSSPAEILSKLSSKSGYAHDEKLQFFEEVSYRPDVVCSRIDDKSTFLDSRLEDGDIICIQNLSTGGIDEDFRCPDVPSFFAYLLKKQIVHFRSLENPREDGFSLDLLKTDSYDEVVGRLSRKIRLEDPSRIRLTGHDLSSHEPKLIPIEYQPPVTLIDMLLSSKQLTDIMYYEVLDVPYPELLLEEVLNVGFYNAAQNEVTSHNIRIQKSKTVEDLLLELKTRVKLSDPEVELRLVCIHQHKIYKIFSPSTAIEQLERHECTKYSLRAEEIPAEEKNRTPEDRMIHVYHYMEANQNLVSKHFGEPFLLFVRKWDTLSQVKLRIQTRLQVPDDEFSKWKFSFVLYTRLQYLQDSDIVAEYFQKMCVYGDWEQYLGLEHTDTTKKKACAPNNHNSPAAFRIYNS